VDVVSSADAIVPDALIRLPGADRPVSIVHAQGTASGQFWTVDHPRRGPGRPAKDADTADPAAAPDPNATRS